MSIESPVADLGFTVRALALLLEPGELSLVQLAVPVPIESVENRSGRIGVVRELLTNLVARDESVTVCVESIE